MRFVWRAVVCLVLSVVFVAGCKGSGGGGSNASGAGASAAGELKTFPIRGKIVSVDAAKGSVMLDHEAVPGFMEAMTMSYKLKDASVASEQIGRASCRER